MGIDVGNLRYWKPPGPVAAAFMLSTSPTCIIMGPVGSGKTTTVINKIIMICARQKPGRDGVKRIRFTAVRDTYQQLWDTTLESWFKIVPKELGEFTGTKGREATHIVPLDIPRSVRLANGESQRWTEKAELTIKFLAVGDHKVEDVMRGFETTGFWLNELDLCAQAVYEYATSRTGRYPGMADGGPSWHGILADCNAPSAGNWLLPVIQNPPADVDLFIQPAGDDPAAENVENLPKGYYIRKSSVSDLTWKRMYQNIPGLAPEKPSALLSAALIERGSICTLFPPDQRTPLIMGVDVGGSIDASVLYFRRGADGRSIPPVRMTGVNTVGVAARAHQDALRLGVDAVFVDEGGIGKGVYDQLLLLSEMAQHRYQVRPVQFGSAAHGVTREGVALQNKRTEMWWTLKEWLEDGGAIGKDPLLLSDLALPEYEDVYLQREGETVRLIRLRSKKELRAEGKPSPDIGDALALTFAFPVLPRGFQQPAANHSSGDDVLGDRAWSL